MAQETISYIASGDIYPSRVVCETATPFYVAQSGTPSSTAKPVGVSQEGTYYAPGLAGVASNPAAPDGKGLRVYGEGEECLLIAGANVSAFQFLKSDANGLGVPITLTATADPEWFVFRSDENQISGYPVRGKVKIGNYIDN